MLAKWFFYNSFYQKHMQLGIFEFLIVDSKILSVHFKWK